MHFWIDKRSSQLHNYGGAGRGRPPGSGGFYSRTFGSRHHPPLVLRSSNSPSSYYPAPQNRYTNNSNPSPNHPPRQPQVSTSRDPSFGSYENPEVTTSNNFQCPFNGFRFQGLEQPTLSEPEVGTSPNCPPYQLHQYPNGNPNNIVQSSIDGNFLRNYIGGGGMSGFNPPSRRPRSQVQQPQGIPNRRRSSGGSTNAGNPRRSSINNRWSYDPYNLHQARASSAHQHPPVHMVDRTRPDWSSSGTPTSPETGITSPINMSSVELGNSNHHPRVTQGSTTPHSIVDPAWRRTKRIGLTLCFMAFILMSTVAAKFIIEGPWLIDKTPKSERTESAIYFFLTELIFVAFALALFFTGITCLRKRTNAYLLRQFNQYILQTSPHAGSGTMGSPEYFNSHTNPHPQSGMSPSHIINGNNVSINPQHSHSGMERPFHPHYLPSLESHLMMNMSAMESSRFVEGFAKPPPYHIALYLPIPDEQAFSSGKNKDFPDKSRNSYGNRIVLNEDHSSTFISSEASFVCDKTDESDEEGDEVGPERKRQRKYSDESRPETPPPPYGQI